MSNAAPLPYKISTLVYLQNPDGDLLLLQRLKAPNYGLWSPIGGKLEMHTGESPFEAAMRETAEETGLQLTDGDLHLFAMIAEKNYEDRMHWLMFLFHCRRPIEHCPPAFDEGTFAFHHPDSILNLPIPQTDRIALWPAFFNHRDGFTALRADCQSGKPIHITTEQALTPNT